MIICGLPTYVNVLEINLNVKLLLFYYFVIDYSYLVICSPSQVLASTSHHKKINCSCSCFTDDFYFSIFLYNNNTIYYITIFNFKNISFYTYYLFIQFCF